MAICSVLEVGATEKVLSQFAAVTLCQSKNKTIFPNCKHFTFKIEIKP